MANDDIELDGHGRKPNVRPLTWHDTKAQLKRTVARTPEVMVRISGGGKTTQHVKAHLDYITRNGKLEGISDQGEKIGGIQNVADLHEAWNLEFGHAQGRYKQAVNIILSMPSGTDPDKVLKAAQNFARDQFSSHQYLMVLHTPDTDPRQPAPDHPHVHLVVKAEDRDGKRINTGKGALQAWRESFAGKLREQGIEANASRRHERGVTRKATSPAEYQIIKRGGNSTALAKRFLEAARELQHGDNTPKPWELAMAARRRDVVREMTAHAARLAQENDHALAASVDRHVRNLPALDTERHLMKRAIVNQVNERRQEQDRPPGQEPQQDRDQDRDRDR